MCRKLTKAEEKIRGECFRMSQNFIFKYYHKLHFKHVPTSY